MKWLKGRKTYITAFLIALVTFVYYIGWIDEKLYLTLIGLLGGGGFAALRDAIGNVEKNIGSNGKN